MNFRGLKKTVLGIVDALLLRNSQIARINEFEVTKQWGLWPDRSLNPLTRYPARYWSQADEDSITLKILDRLDINEGNFIEIGCGDGLQNNTLVLLSKGWHGGWIDGVDLSFDIPVNSNLKHKKGWVTKTNIIEYIKSVSFPHYGDKVNYLSLDLDGNDYHFMVQILESDLSVDVIVLEYNARFPNYSEWIMPYQEDHQWNGDDYFGASLYSFRKLLEKFDYTLVACSVQGSNAFFIHNRFIDRFSDVPIDFDKLYQPPLYYLVHDWAQKASPQTVKQMLKQV